MLSYEEAKENTQHVAMPSYGEPEITGEDEDFIYLKVLVPKILIACAAGGCGGCSECGPEEE